jgi:hypothetical protein
MRKDEKISNILLSIAFAVIVILILIEAIFPGTLTGP